MHNLFGDPNIVHVDLDEHGAPRLTHVVRGDRTQEMLSYVEYFEDDLLARMRRHIEQSLHDGRMSLEESALLQRRYEAGLASYTYLARERAPLPPPVPGPVSGQVGSPGAAADSGR
jgi:arginine decarboxylase